VPFLRFLKVKKDEVSSKVSSILDDIRFYEHKSSETIKISELLSYHPLIDFTCLARSGSRLIFSCALMNWSTSARASSVS